MKMISRLFLSRFHLIVAVSFLSFVLPGCHSTPSTVEQELGPAERSELAKIRERYKPSECFRADFSLDVRDGGSKHSATGTVVADSMNDRMSFVFRDSIFGIMLNRVIVSNQWVWIQNAGGGRSGQLPLSQFELRGLGNNSISFPFSIFQELLYGRLPDSIFSRQAKVERSEDALTVRLNGEEGSYRYDFRSNRLSRLVFDRTGTGERVAVDLLGEYGKTVYPARIRLRTEASGRTVETMDIAFKTIRLNAACPGSLFAIPGRSR